MRRALRRLRDKWRLAVVATLGVVALTIAILLTSPWALVLWGAGIAVAVGADVVKGALQQRVEGALASALASPSSLFVTVCLDVGDYVYIPGKIGAHVVPRSGHGVRITIETSSTQAIILHGIKPVVVSHNPLRKSRPVPHMGVVPVRKFDLWLSEDPPRISTSGSRGFPYKVTAEDPEILLVTAHVAAGDVKWYMDLLWSCNGREGVHRVDIDGEPFRTAA